MNNKVRKLLIFLVLIIFISLAIIIYFRYTKASSVNDTVPINNYYNTEFLFNNNYIKVSNTIENSKKIDKTLNIYTKENVLYINHNNEIKTVNNLPIEKGTIYYNDLGNNCYELADLIKNDLYYANTCLNSKKNINFEKISSVTKGIYTPTINRNGIYVTRESLNSNFIVDTTIGNLKYISSKDNVLGLYNDIDKTMPYFDYICADSNTDVCKNLMFYVTFKNELVFKNNNNPLKDENKKNIIVQDLFGTFSIESHKNINLNNISYNKLKHYDYLFRVYVLSKDNKLYFVDIDKKSNMNLVLKPFSSKKIKSINYDSSEGNVKKVLITYEDGKFVTISSSFNNKIVLSTIYDRASITNVK